MQAEMWCLPVADFATLDELLPHQELRDAGKLVPWSPTMRSVFFISHQWTSFDGPDHTTQQLPHEPPSEAIAPAMAKGQRDS